MKPDLIPRAKALAEIDYLIVSTERHIRQAQEVIGRSEQQLERLRHLRGKVATIPPADADA